MESEWHKVYEKNAKNYLENHKISCWTKKGFQELLEITEQLVESIEGIKTIIDIGCGPGAYCELLSNKEYIVTGLDYSKENINIAKKKAPKAKLIVGNCYDLPFDDQSFDLSISIGLLQCLQDEEKFLKEMIRVTKKAIILSTIYRNYKHKDPKELLRKKLKKDPWPVRDYHPTELTDMLEKEGYSTRVKLSHKGKRITHGFFLVAIRK